jgi:hypothetical protein
MLYYGPTDRIYLRRSGDYLHASIATRTTPAEAQL